jgi:hypothetical protein
MNRSCALSTLLLQWASFYHIVGSNAALYQPASVGRTLGYNGIAIAIIGDAFAPLLMAFAQASPDPSSLLPRPEEHHEEDEATRYAFIKVFLLVIVLPISASLPIYLRHIGSRSGV